MYLFDARRHVHACELTASYELEYLYTTSAKAPSRESAREKFVDELEEANRDNQQVEYVHTGRIKLEGPDIQAVGSPTVAEWAELLAEWDGDREKAHTALMEGQSEYERCNWRY